MPHVISHQQDVGFSFMRDKRLPPDTLFIVAEADFRFYEADDMSPLKWASVVSKHEEEMARQGQSDESQMMSPRDALRPQPYAKSKATQAGQRPLSAKGFTQPQRPASGDAATLDPSLDLQNLVSICTRATRWVT